MPRRTKVFFHYGPLNGCSTELYLTPKIITIPMVSRSEIKPDKIKDLIGKRKKRGEKRVVYTRCQIQYDEKDRPRTVEYRMTDVK